MELAYLSKKAVFLFSSYHIGFEQFPNSEAKKNVAKLESRNANISAGIDDRQHATFRRRRHQTVFRLRCMPKGSNGYKRLCRVET